MEHDYLQKLRQHPTWRLLCADNAPLIISFFYRVFIAPNCRSLRQKAIANYWGDLDSHGFAILSRLRGYYPKLASLLMNEQTLEAFQNLWVTEPKTSAANPDNLTTDEQRVFSRLRNQAIRLEQERIGFNTLIAELNAITPDQ